MSEEEKKKPNDDRMTDVLTARAALLDFYSDRAVAHASFLVASIFGLVTLMAIVQLMINHALNLLIYISLIPFVVFSYLGFHSLRRFGKYASVADKLQQSFLNYAKLKIDLGEGKEKIDFELYVIKKLYLDKQQLVVSRFLGISIKGELLVLYSLYVVLISVLSFVVYFQSEDITLYMCWGITILSFVLLIHKKTNRKLISILDSIKKKISKQNEVRSH